MPLIRMSGKKAGADFYHPSLIKEKENIIVDRWLNKLGQGLSQQEYTNIIKRTRSHQSSAYRL